MADKTQIEWADATVNAINGCTVHSPGCKRCYAMRLAGTRLRSHPSRAGLTMPTKAGPVWTGEVRLNEKALLQPLSWKKPRRIFWNAHGDTFHENVPEEWIDRVFAVCGLTPQHTHMILTKRPERMRDYILNNRWQEILDEQYDIQASGLSEEVPVGEIWPLPNIWIGTSVEDQPRTQRIDDLRNTPAAKRFISFEPLIGDVGQVDLSGIDLAIIGGEQAHDFRDNGFEANARSLIEQCRAAGTAVFMKQMCGKPGKLPHIPDDLFIREIV